MNQPIRVSKREIIAAIQKCAAELGHMPTVMELTRAFAHITYSRIQAQFDTYPHALKAAGFEPVGPGRQVEMEALVADWARIVRALGKAPTQRDYNRHSRYSVRPLRARFGKWSDVPGGMLKVLEKTSADGKWDDVLDIIKVQMGATAGASESHQPGVLWTSSPGLMAGRREYGEPITVPGMANAPTTEQGVVRSFGMLARELGFVILHAQTEFPDCEALRLMQDDRWQRVRIEFELKSHNFLEHRHDANGCDLVVCWEHNWPECAVEVLELKRVVKK